MFVKFGCFGKKSQKIFPGMIFIVGDFSGDGPEVDMDIEKIHVNGYLDAFTFYIFVFIDFFYDYHLSVSDGSDSLFAGDLFPVRLVKQGREFGTF